MKTRSLKAVNNSGITLIEVLVVFGVLLVLAALLLPTLGRARINGPPGVCINNQRQMAIGFKMFADDNGGKYPWQIQSAADSRVEATTSPLVSQHFKNAAPYFGGQAVYLCPTETLRHLATNIADLTDQNVSYFLDFDAVTNSASSILTGDRHLLLNGEPVGPGLRVVTSKAVLGWTRELHPKDRQPRGFLSFTDTHAEGRFDAKLTEAFRRQGLRAVRLALP